MAEMAVKGPSSYRVPARNMGRNIFLKKGLVFSAAWAVLVTSGGHWGLQQQHCALSTLALVVTGLSQEATAKGEEATSLECYPKEVFHMYI